MPPLAHELTLLLVQLIEVNARSAQRFEHELGTRSLTVRLSAVLEHIRSYSCCKYLSLHIVGGHFVRGENAHCNASDDCTTAL